jgi:DnaJ-class molecular chaperone
MLLLSKSSRLYADKHHDSRWHSANQLVQIGEAYQVLSDPQLRAAYDKYGKDSAKPSSGFGKMTHKAGRGEYETNTMQRIHPSSLVWYSVAKPSQIGETKTTFGAIPRS